MGMAEVRRAEWQQKEAGIKPATGDYAEAVAVGGKRTCPFALHMSANAPKRTSGLIAPLYILSGSQLTTK